MKLKLKDKARLAKQDFQNNKNGSDVDKMHHHYRRGYKSYYKQDVEIKCNRKVINLTEETDFQNETNVHFWRRVPLKSASG